MIYGPILLKAIKFEMSSEQTTTVPPIRAHWPGFSPKTTQTNNGANTDSSKISNATSGDLIKRGPTVSKQVAEPIKRPRPIKSDQ